MRTVKLGEISQFVMGQAPPGKDCNKNGVGTPFVKAGEFNELRPIIHEWTTRPFKLAKRTDILVCVVGATSGKLNLGEDCAIGRSVAAIRPHSDKVEQNYLYNYLQTWTSRLRALSQGCAQGVITKEMLHNIPVPLPTMQEQKRITSLLVQCDTVIRKRRETMRLLDDFLRSTFLDLFGDPANNSKRLPIIKCGNIAIHVSSGSTPLGGEATYLKNGIMFIRSQNVQINHFDFSDVAYIGEEVHNQMKRTWVQSGDVLLNITGASIGRVACYRGESNKANVNQHVCIIRLDNSKALPEYLSFLISMSNYQKKILSRNSGATRQAFNFEQIKDFDIPLSSLEKQKQFVAVVEKIDRLKQKMKSSETELRNLFNCVMQKTFNGKLE